MGRLALALAACVLLLLPASAPAADPYAPLKKRLTEFLTRQMRANQVKGLAVVLLDGPRIAWMQGFGWADEAQDAPAGPDTVWRMGSISKVVTSYRAAMLAQAGSLDLDGDVRRHVPAFAVRSRFPEAAITPRMLMTHHSGLPTDILAGMWTDRPESLEAFIPRIAGESLCSPPGREWRYSNVGFSLLGRAIEEVEGLPFAEAMRRGLLAPLGMADSGFELTPALARRLAQGYVAGRPAPSPPLRDQPAGSLYSTAGDMARFMSFALSGGRGLLTEEWTQRMGVVQFPGHPLDFGLEMGLGWMVSGLSMADGHRLWWHGGAAAPFQTLMVVQPDEDLGVALLSNSMEASRFLPQAALMALDMALEARTRRRAPPPPRVPPPRVVRLAAEELASFAGPYATVGAQLGHVRLAGAGLYADIPGRAFEMVPLLDGAFAVQRDTLAGLFPRLDRELSVRPAQTDGRRFLVLQGQAMPLPFEQLPRTPLPPAWTARLGNYAPDGPCEGLCYVRLELAQAQDGVLTARLFLAAGSAPPGPPAVFPLLPVSDAEAVIAGAGVGTGQAVRAVEGGLYHSGYLFRPAP
ncbi:Penicillin-binding protein 4* [Fundidesulfovibrio magnetotacticus]|uniref:Penicillin-binding protein 4 n=1 Tax=Fundidesulfovibrio magnetotacticus TaxID=2730080 RepID=A0A6V8LSH5_9BACT|nr:serine hydrolase domain-containing protein [Fundidesulfovibrio magnetotacticus]GFK93258.1 Penicillin-binding protein 4* [Fundidesulfovibrio magnetotacticus]